jgi:hypothetical protein
VSPLRLHEDARTRLEEAADHADAVESADEVTGTPTAWYDGLDPATAWALVWIADTATTPTAGELISMAGRFGYRHARLLLGPDGHPEYSDPRTFDIVAELVLRLAAELSPSPTFYALPSEVFACHRHLARRIGDVVFNDPPDRGELDGLVSVLQVALDLGFAVGLVEAHLAVGLPLARERAS